MGLKGFPLVARDIFDRSISTTRGEIRPIREGRAVTESSMLEEGIAL